MWGGFAQMWKSRHKGGKKDGVESQSKVPPRKRSCVDVVLVAGTRDSLGFPPFLIFGADLVLCH